MSSSGNNRLGKGLDSLIPSGSFGQDDDLSGNAIPQAVKQSDATASELPIKSIDTNPYQPRGDFEQTQLQELAESIRTHGVLQPIIVTAENDWRYRLVAGERRLRASQLAGKETIPAIVRSFSEQQKLEIALIENIQRENLKPLELAVAYQKLDDEFNLTHGAIGKSVGKAESTITNIIRLLKLSEKSKQALNSGVISEGHARTILSLTDHDKQDQFLAYIIKHNLTVRHAENLVREFKGGVKIKRQAVLKNEAPVNKLTTDLGEYLGTKVSVYKTAKGGKLQIEYYSDEELARIYQAILGKEPTV